MFIELIDLLRCPRAHEDSWLVLAIHEKQDRDICAGVLGCPICRAEYPIRDGEALFDDAEAVPPTPQRGAYDEADEDAAMRCAAMLDLFDPGGAIILGGRWSRVASSLFDITQVSALLLNPPAGLDRGSRPSVIRAGAQLPVAAGSMRGIALDDATASPSVIEDAARALKAGGRLVAPVSVAVPAGVTERARDDEYWVGQLDAPTSAPVQLVRHRPGIRG